MELLIDTIAPPPPPGAIAWPLKKAVVFDLDGTLFDPSHRQHHLRKDPKDWDAFFAEMDQDEPHDHIADLAYLIYHKHPDWTVLLATGRDERHRDLSVSMCEKHAIPFEKLYMRARGDRRDDSVVKLEFVEQMRADGFEPIMVFEDRKRVVDAWRAAGIPCLQVAPGDF